MDDKEFEEKVKAWRGQPVDRILISDLAIFIDQLIAYVEELREDLDTKFIPSGIARNKLDNMRAILQTHYQVRIEEPDAFAVDRIRELEEENEKLKEEFTDYQKWARNCCDLLEEGNAKLKEELQTFKDRWIGT